LREEKSKTSFSKELSQSLKLENSFYLTTNREMRFSAFLNAHEKNIWVSTRNIFFYRLMAQNRQRHAYNFELIFKKEPSNIVYNYNVITIRVNLTLRKLGSISFLPTELN